MQAILVRKKLRLGLTFAFQTSVRNNHQPHFREKRLLNNRYIEMVPSI